MARYWIGVASRDHVRGGVCGGFAQLGHGKSAPVERLANGDWLVYYSPRTSLDGGDPVRAFTALGQVDDDAAREFEQTTTFHPWRRRIRYEPARDAEISPLLEELSFTRGRKNWGVRFRASSFEISQADFHTIARAMNVRLCER